MVLSKKTDKNKKEKVMMSEFPIPEEVMLSSIIPLLSMDDVARSSVVSSTWLRYWRNTPILTFQDPSGLDATMTKAFQDFSTYSQVVSDARTNFITWVNNILNNHMGCTLEEFRLVYYLNNTHQAIIDSWVVWALCKNVQRLVLDFTPPSATYGSCNAPMHYYVLDRTLFNNTANKLYLTTLCLKSVNVDTQTVLHLLHACASTLEDLCIDDSQYLTGITAAAAELSSLKYLVLLDCPKLETIDIQAPKLVSFTYSSGWHSNLRVFNIENASKLSHATILVRLEERLVYVLRTLFKYFSHLEHLKLRWHADDYINHVPDKFPVLANLKQLELCVLESGERTLVEWIPFIGACPRLEKLALEIGGWFLSVPPRNVYLDKCPLRWLKTFEIRRFHGHNLDVDIANFVVRNGINLEEVILHPCDLLSSPNLEDPFDVVDFKLPPHVKLVIVE